MKTRTLPVVRRPQWATEIWEVPNKINHTGKKQDIELTMHLKHLAHTIRTSSDKVTSKQGALFLCLVCIHTLWAQYLFITISVLILRILHGFMKDELRMAEVRTMSRCKHQLHTRITTVHSSNICLKFSLLKSRLMIESEQGQETILSVCCVLNCSPFRI